MFARVRSEHYVSGSGQTGLANPNVLGLLRDPTRGVACQVCCFATPSRHEKGSMQGERWRIRSALHSYGKHRSLEFG